MTLKQAQSDWEKAHPGEDFTALSHDEQMTVLEAAVRAERAKRK